MQVEAALISSKYVDNIMVYADPFHNYCVALVVPARQVLEKWANEAGVNYSDYVELCDKTEAVAEIKRSFSEVSFLAFSPDALSLFNAKAVIIIFIFYLMFEREFPRFHVG